MLEEGVSDHRHERMTMQALPGSSLEVIETEFGIVAVPGYWRYPEAFMGARWIWTINLVFDNTVLLRKTVR
jgi:hypothetical protein